MTLVHQTLPASNPGDFLCELTTAGQGIRRYIVKSVREAHALARAGAAIWKGRHGGWVREN